jgi:hypothetical protein
MVLSVGPVRGMRESASVSRFEEFQPVTVRVLAIEATPPREVVIELHGSGSGAKPARPGVQVADQQAGMCSAGRAEVLLHAEVQLDAVAGEPAAAAGGQRGWFSHFLEA